MDEDYEHFSMSREEYDAAIWAWMDELGTNYEQLAAWSANRNLPSASHVKLWFMVRDCPPAPRG